jgi:uncharacterized protein YecE (DUF72 family)
MEEKKLKISNVEAISLLGSLSVALVMVGQEFVKKSEQKAEDKRQLENRLKEATRAFDTLEAASRERIQEIADRERQTQDALRVRLHIVESELANRDHEEAMGRWEAQGLSIQQELRGATPEAIGYLVEKLVEHRLAKPVLRQIRAY